MPDKLKALGLRFPHPLTLLLACIVLAALLSHLLPAGQFDRWEDPATGRSVVVAGTYHTVEPAPVGPFQAVVAIPKGMADAAAVIFFVFLVGGGFAVVERTGALTRLVHQLVGRLERRETLVIPIACAVFGLGGILIQMQEELIAFVPVLLLLSRRLGFDPLTACAMSLGAAAVGAAFSPVNPFQVVIAQKVAEVAPQSGLEFRVAFLVPAMAIWMWGTVRHARAVRSTGAGEAGGPSFLSPSPSTRDHLIIAIVLTAFILFITGARLWGWDFEHFSAVFFLMGIAAGLAGGLRVSGTVDALIDGFRSLTFAALLIGFARAIYVVMQEGRIIDTLVQGIFAPVGALPTTLSAIGMMFAQSLIHVPVPSTSGQAVLTMPVLVPLADLLGLSRQVVVLAYQYGAGLCEILTPTNGALMAMLAACGIPYDQWFRFALRLWALLVALGIVALVAAVVLGV